MRLVRCIPRIAKGWKRCADMKLEMTGTHAKILIKATKRWLLNRHRHEALRRHILELHDPVPGSGQLLTEQITPQSGSSAKGAATKAGVSGFDRRALFSAGALARDLASAAPARQITRSMLPARRGSLRRLEYR